MAKIKRLILTAIIFANPCLSLKCAKAEDGSTCHDMPARQAVLDEGNAYLHHTGDSGTHTTLGPEDLGALRSMYSVRDTDVQGPRGIAPQLQDPPLESRWQLEHMNLDSPPAIWAALGTAEKLERYNAPSLAKILYDRMITKTDTKFLDDQQKARIWDGAARTKLSVPYEPFSSRVYPFFASSSAQQIGVRRHKSDIPTNHFIVVDSVDRTESQTELQAAGDLCTRALKVWNAKTGHSAAAVSDLMILGALAEHDHKPSQAFACYLPAIQLKHNSVNLPISQSTDLSNLVPNLQAILNKIEKSDASDEQALAYLSEFEALIARVPDKHINISAVKDRTMHLIAFYNNEIRIRPCLEMANKLNDTAFNLERSNHFDMAWKLYEQALEIKQTNLGPDNIETIKQTVDMARTAAEQKRYAVSTALFEKALAGLRKNPFADSSDMVRVLESYAQTLVQAKQTAKADKVYDQARALALKAKH